MCQKLLRSSLTAGPHASDFHTTSAQGRMRSKPRSASYIAHPLTSPCTLLPLVLLHNCRNRTQRSAHFFLAAAWSLAPGPSLGLMSISSACIIQHEIKVNTQNATCNIAATPHSLTPVAHALVEHRGAGLKHQHHTNTMRSHPACSPVGTAKLAHWW